MFISNGTLSNITPFLKNGMWPSLISMTRKLSEQSCYIFLNMKHKSIFVNNFNADNYH